MAQSRQILITLHGALAGLDKDGVALFKGLNFVNDYGNSSSASAPITMPTANENLIGAFAKATATSGDTRAAYIRLNFSGAGVSGEAIRGYGAVDTAGVATGGTVNGAHLTLGVSGAGTIGGAGNALRATLGLGAATNAGGTLAVIQADSDIAADATIPARTAFIRCTNSGSGKLSYLLNLPAVASAGLVAAHVTDAMSHSVRVVDAAGKVLYLMATETATNRTGGA